MHSDIDSFFKYHLTFYKPLTGNLLAIQHNLPPGTPIESKQITFEGITSFHLGAQEHAQEILSLYTKTIQPIAGNPPRLEKAHQIADLLRSIDWNNTRSWAEALWKVTLLEQPAYKPLIDYFCDHYEDASTYFGPLEGDDQKIVPLAYDLFQAHQEILHGIEEEFCLYVHAVNISAQPCIPSQIRTTEFKYRGISYLYELCQLKCHESKEHFKEVLAFLETLEPSLFKRCPYLKLAYERIEHVQKILDAIDWSSTKNWLTAMHEVMHEKGDLATHEVEHAAEQYPTPDTYENSGC